MYKIKKVINNNAVLITDPNNEQEMIFMGNGIDITGIKER